MTSLLPFASFAIIAYFAIRYLMNSRARPPEIGPTASQPLFGDWTSALANAIPVSNDKRSQLENDLLTAGDHRASALDEFLAKRNTYVLIAFLVAAATFAIGIADGHEVVFATVFGIASLLTYTIPRILLSGRASRRKSDIEKAIPDAMDMVAMSIQGGLPLTTAIAQVASRLGKLFPDLAQELEIVSRQAKSGAVEQAFDGFAQRISIPEIVAWCAMMRQSQKLGGGLAKTLRDYAARIRIDRQSRAEQLGNTASLKLLLPVVLCLAPPIGILLIGPAVIELRDFIHREKGVTQELFEQVQQTPVNVE